MRIVFMGTPDFAVPILKYLNQEHDVVLVVTQPDKIVGRHHELTYSPVKKVAIDEKIDVFQPVKIREEYEIISEINPDIIVTCAYGQIVPKQILEIPKYGCVNVHASLLPKYRGAAPIQWCLLNGEEKTGVTLMYMDEHMDTGDMIAKVEYTILPEDNVGSLHDKLSALGVELLKENLHLIENGINHREKQNENDSSYAPMIKRDDERLDFSKSGKSIVNKIKALNPWPLANFIFDDKEIKVIKASFKEKNGSKAGKVIIDKTGFFIECEDGIIELEMVKPMGKKEMTGLAFVNGINKKGEFYVG